MKTVRTYAPTVAAIAVAIAVVVLFCLSAAHAISPPTSASQTPFWTMVDQNVHKAGYTKSVSTAETIAAAIEVALPTDAIGVEITNLDSANVMYLQFDGTDASAANGYRLLPQTSMRCPGFKAELDKISVFAAVAVDVGFIAYTKSN